MALYIPRRFRDYTGKILKPVRPNAGVEAMYRKKLIKLVEDMNASVCYWLGAAYKAHPPKIAQDAEWKESDHPRVGGGEHAGEFTSGGGGSGGPTPKVQSIIKKATQGSGLTAGKLTSSEREELESFLASQPKSDKPAYRGIWMSSQDWAKRFDEWQPGNSVEIKGLSSFTADPIRSAAYGTGGDYFVQFEVPAGSTVDISKWSVYPQEEEHVPTHNENLEIVERKQHSPGFWKIKLGQPIKKMAMDAVPANELRDALAKLARQWLHNFDELADQLADYFATDVAERSDSALADSFRRLGFTVKFTMTPAMRDIINATVHENVSLIKSIPRQYLTQVEGLTMRSVQSGRDLGFLAKGLQKQFGVTKKRAALIARDQNNKATASMNRARQTELGITEAIWVHSSAGKKPRPTHVKMNGKRYDVSEGMYDSHEGRYVLPGELINCRCMSRSVIPGFV